MSKQFSSEYLYRIRNDISIPYLLEHVLRYPCRQSQGCFRFICPKCLEFNTSVNLKNNLARCFTCQRNFNTIDLVMLIKDMSFTKSILFLHSFLPNHLKSL